MLNVRNLNTIDTYAAAAAYLGTRARAQLAHNTTIRRDDQGDIVVTYHQTDIITYHADGTMTLQDGGWATATTVQRLHDMTPAHVRVRREMARGYYAGHRYTRGHYTAVAVPGEIERRIIGALRIDPR